MNSGKDLVTSVADLLVVVGLSTTIFLYDAPGVIAALFFYGVFRHAYATICTEQKVKGSQCLCDDTFWNLLDLSIVVVLFVTGFKYVGSAYGWPYFLAMLYVAARHVFYASVYEPPVDTGTVPKSRQALTNVALDFVVLSGFAYSIFQLHSYAQQGDSIVDTLEAPGWALAALMIYVVFRHAYEAFCVGLEVKDHGYLSEQLFYNLWDLLVIGVGFAAGFIWQAPAPFVVAVLFVVARFILWACMKSNYPQKQATSQ